MDKSIIKNENEADSTIDQMIRKDFELYLELINYNIGFYIAYII